MRRLAALLLVVAACGDDGNVNPLADAPPAPDTPPDTPTVGLVTLTITLSGVPQADVRVYFQNADSSLVSMKTTDANGVASETMTIGGYVTAIDPFFELIPQGGPSNLGDIKTFANVKPGDNLVLKATSRRGLDITQMTLLAPEDPGAASYHLYTSCGEYFMQPAGGSGEPAGGLINFVNCPATIDLVVETRDLEGLVRGSFARNGVALTEGGTLDLLEEVYATATTSTWMYSSVPSNIDNVNLDAFFATSRGPVVPVFGGARVTSGSATLSIAHGTAADAVQVNVSELTGADLESVHTFVEWGAPTLAYMLTMNNGSLMSDFTTGPTFDAAGHAVNWTTGGTNTRSPDLAIMHAQVDRISPAQAFSWEIAASHDGENKIVLPVLPEPDDVFNVLEGDSVFIDQLLVAQLPGGYDAIRENALTFSVDPTRAGVAGATGALVLQELLGEGPSGKRVPRRPRAPTTFTRR